MKRKDFLRNSLMAIAVSLVPKILQPVVPEMETEVILQKVRVEFGEGGSITWTVDKTERYTVNTKHSRTMYLLNE